MNLVEFSELIVKKITKEPDLVKVQEFTTDDETVIEIIVSEEDMGRVIGKQGRIAKAIRTVMRNVAKIDNKKVTVEIK